MPMMPTPASSTSSGPWRSIRRPSSGLRMAEMKKPNENAPAVTPRSQPNSASMGGNSSENAVRALTATPMVTKATATMAQP